MLVVTDLKSVSRSASVRSVTTRAVLLSCDTLLLLSGRFFTVLYYKVLGVEQVNCVCPLTVIVIATRNCSSADTTYLFWIEIMIFNIKYDFRPSNIAIITEKGKICNYKLVSMNFLFIILCQMKILSIGNIH